MSVRLRIRSGRVRAAELLGAAALSLIATRALALTIVPTYDSSITSDPQGATIQNTINAAISTFNTKISDNITINITFQEVNDGLGGSSTSYQTVSYATYLNKIRNFASSVDDAIALNHLPEGPGNPVTGDNSVLLTDALARALGFISAPQTGPELATHRSISILHGAGQDPATWARSDETIRRSLQVSVESPNAVEAVDGTISLNTSIMNVTTGATPADQYSLTAVVSHEIDEVLGSGSSLNGLDNGAPAPTGPVFVQDLYRYDLLGHRSFTTDVNAKAYFSIDVADTILRQNETQPASPKHADYSDWWSPNADDPHVQDAYCSPGKDPVMGPEWRLLDVLGWSYAPRGVWVDFNYGGLYFGLYDQPFNTISAAIANVPVGGLILIKGGGTTSELPNITKPLTMTTVGGTSQIGQ